MSETFGDSEILEEFIAEATEHLDRLDDLFHASGAQPSAEELNAAFRSLHTLKGTAGMLGLAEIEAVAHAGEDLLAALRSGEAVYDTSVRDALVEASQVLRLLLEAASARVGADQIVDWRAILERLGSTLPKEAQRPHDLAPKHPQAEGPPAQGSPEPSSDTAGENRPAQALAGTPPSGWRLSIGDIERLTSLSVELLLLSKQLSRGARSAEVNTAHWSLARIQGIAADLHEVAMAARLAPLSVLWERLARVASETAAALGKEVSLVPEGTSVRVDRSALEVIRDPLVHLIRNSVDHGIEDPLLRVAHNKPRMGRISISARQEANYVVVEVEDDGAGLDTEALTRRAVEVGLLEPERARNLSWEERCRLVFLPGLSTAPTTTKVSGRGVGMDVVRRGIESLGGTISVSTTPGRGTCFRMRLPIGVALLSLIVFRVAGQAYALPAEAAVEVMAVNETTRRKLAQEGRSGLRWRGGNPLVALDLASMFGVRRDGSETGPKEILVVSWQDRLVGLAVDAVLEPEEAMVRPLPQAVVAEDLCWVGACLLDGGEVALVADPGYFARLAGVLRAASPTAEAPSSGLGRAYLTARSGKHRVALNLAATMRVARIPTEEIREVGKWRAAVLGDELLPIFELGELLGQRRRLHPKEGFATLLVAAEGGGRFAIQVDEVEEVAFGAETDPRMRSGVVRGGGVVGGEPVEVLDPAELLRRAQPAFAAMMQEGRQ